MIFLNGEWMPVEDAKISVLDRGFIFGDGVYDVVPVYDHKLFRFDAHMARLERGLKELRIPNPFDRPGWLDRIRRLVASQTASDQIVYIQVTRGVAMRDHVMPQDITPTVFAMANVMKLPSAAQREQGVACVTADDFRWEKAHIKSTSLLGSVLARQISFDAGAVETVMFRHGFLSEASASNVWVVKRSTVVGPPRDNLVLAGIRYDLIEEICRAAGLAFELRPIPRQEVLEADELILSSATREVLAVVTLDGKPVGTGQPGPVFRRLFAGYRAAIEQAKATAQGPGR